jgi:Domain of unknown function (DUF4145)
MPRISPYQDIHSLGEIPYVGEPFRCPHCAVTIQPTPELGVLATLPDGGLWFIWKNYCAACREYIFQIGFLANNKAFMIRPQDYLAHADLSYFVYPKTAQRPPPPQGVPGDVLADYLEACLVLNDSSKASAALSRRCLQTFLRTVVQVEASELRDEIQVVIDSNILPSYIAENLNVVREIGNFAAHPNKSKQTGVIVEVEPGEAEWNLDVLESLFDFFFVTLAKNRQVKDGLNQKLIQAGRKPVK